MNRALFIVTNIESTVGISKPTGFDVREAAYVWYELTQRGWDVSFASVGGGDVKGVLKGEPTPAIDSFIAAFTADLVVPTTKVRSEFAHHYELLYFVGGLGCMWDFPYQPDIHTLLQHALSRQTLIAAVCHGPAALLGLKRTDGQPVVAGRAMTAFSDAEEAARGVLDKLPFSLEQELVRNGADVSAAPDGVSYVVVDGLLITAQNPSSLSDLCAELMATPLPERTAS